MRTLKKTLCLVLVLAMVLSCGIFASATFTDDSEIQYTEAVEVLSGIGVITGYTDGSFAPTKTLTRAEACVIIARLLNASDLQGKAPFTDMAGYENWAESAIAYCASKGIVEGVGNGKFDPAGTLTGSAWLKMLAVALGYDAEQYGMTGTTWEIGVATVAKKLGLTAGNATVDQTAPCTREEACLYALNALNYTATSTTYVVTANGKDYEFDNLNDAAVFAALLDGTLTAAPSTDTLLAANFGVTRYSLAYDLFGDPGVSYQGKILGSAGLFFADEPVATYTAATSEAAILSDLGVTSATVDVHDVTASSATATTSVDLDGVGTASFTGNGVLVNVYNVGTSYYATKLAPSFGSVTVTSKAATKTRGAYTLYTVTTSDGTTLPGKRVYSTVVNEDNDVDTAVVSGDVTSGSKVLYYEVSGCLYISSVDTLTGVLTAKTKSGVMTIDGDTYVAAAAAEDLSGVTVSSSAQTFYVDEYGYILGTKAAASEKDTYAVVLDTDDVTVLENGKLKTVWYATYVGTDGKVETVVTVDKATAAGTSVECKLVGQLVTVVEGVNGSVLTESNVATSVTELDPKNSVLATGLYANSKTLFVYANYTSGALDGTVNTVTGIANVTAASNLTKTWALDLDGDKLVDVVFVLDEPVTAEDVDTYVYVVDDEYTLTAAGFTYDVIIAGEETTLTVSQPVLTAGVLYATIKDNGVDTTTFVVATPSNQKVANKGGLLFLDDQYSSATCSSTVPVYLIDNYDATCETLTFGDISTLSGDVYVLTGSTGAVTAIYVVYTTTND